MTLQWWDPGKPSQQRGVGKPQPEKTGEEKGRNYSLIPAVIFWRRCLVEVKNKHRLFPKRESFSKLVENRQFFWGGFGSPNKTIDLQFSKKKRTWTFSDRFEPPKTHRIPVIPWKKHSKTTRGRLIQHTPETKPKIKIKLYYIREIHLFRDLGMLGVCSWDERWLRW